MKKQSTKRCWKRRARDEKLRGQILCYPHMNMYSSPSYLGAVGFTLSQNLSLAEKEYILMSVDAGLLSAATDSAVGFSCDWSPPPENLLVTAQWNLD